MTDSNKEYVLVTEYFHPDTASTGQLMTDLAVGLHQRGLDMTVYTGQPNYHSGENEKQPRQSIHEGVLVRRIRAPQVRQSSLSRRLLNWAVFTIVASLTLLVSSPDKDREVIFVSNPPVLPVAMWIVCRIRGWEYTYIVYDLYPDQPIELGYLSENGILGRLWKFGNRRALLAAQHVVTLGPVMTERVSRNAGPEFDTDKVRIIHNWEEETFIKPMNKEENWFSKEHDLVDTFTIFYSGNIAHFHDLETLVKAAAEVERDDLQVLIIGEGDNKQNVVQLAEELGLRGDTVRFLPYQPWEDLPYSLTAGDVSVVTVQEGFEGVCVSSKLYTAMAAGTPVLVIAQPHDDEARLVEKFDAGINVPQEDVEGVADAVEQWAENPSLVERHGENAREAFENNFTTEQSVDEYYDMLTQASQSQSERVESHV